MALVDFCQLASLHNLVILVSSAIKFSEGDGKDKFIATTIALHCLSLEQNGILETLLPENVKMVSKLEFEPEKRIQSQNEIHLRGDAVVGKVRVKLGTVISCDPAMVGRSTAVLHATSDTREGKNLVVKASWPTSCRDSEIDFLNTATRMVEGEHAWAKNHLPNAYHSEEVAFPSDSTLESIARLPGGAKIEGGEYVYERRTLRIIIQERLFSLKKLTNAKDLAQVFLDVACVYHWLYLHVGILHRDLSFNNIIWRRVNKRVHGVPTDYDLSSWTAKMNGDYIKTSQHRTGTPPYMAQELLRGTSSVHLYRHDVESLFYIMLLTGARRTIGIPQGLKKPQVIMRESTRLPYQRWFNQMDYGGLGAFKQTFFANQDAIELSKEFEDFRPWLRTLQHFFRSGFGLKNLISSAQTEGLPVWTAAIIAKKFNPTVPEFDDETLGGNVEYITILASIPHLTGELEGLEIRDPHHPLLLPSA